MKQSRIRRGVQLSELSRCTRGRYTGGERSTLMDTTETTTEIPEEIKAQLRETLDDLVKGIRRPHKMKAACERMDRMREENRQLFGEHDIAVGLIRETRDH